MHCGFERGGREGALPNPRRPLLVAAPDVVLDCKQWREHGRETVQWGSVRCVLAKPAPAVQHGALHR